MGGRGNKSKFASSPAVPAMAPPNGPQAQQQPSQPIPPPQQTVPDNSDQAQIVPMAAMAMAANAAAFSATDNSPTHDLYDGRGYFKRQTFSIDTTMALQDYLSDKASPGSLYAPSQDLNYAMKIGAKLTANQQFMKDSLMEGMHNLGYNVNLTRYARVDFMQSLGLANYSSMTAAQLQSALVGRAYSEKGFISTTYNDFKHAPFGSAKTFSGKAVVIKYDAPAKTQALMPGNGPGGALGEVVLAPDQNYTITSVRYTGKQGRSGGSYYPQVELHIKIG